MDLERFPNLRRRREGERSHLADLGNGLGILLAIQSVALFVIGSLLVSADDPIGFALVQMMAMAMGAFFATRSLTSFPLLKGIFLVLVGSFALIGMFLVFDALFYSLNFQAVFRGALYVLVPGIIGVLSARVVFAKRWIDTRGSDSSSSVGG